MESKMEHILASIFHRFWLIFGAKLGGKSEPKSINNGIEKTMKKDSCQNGQKGPKGLVGFHCANVFSLNI